MPCMVKQDVVVSILVRCEFFYWIHPELFRNPTNPGSSADIGGSHMLMRSRSHQSPCELPGFAKE